MSQAIKPNSIQNDLKGINQLAEDGIVGVIDLVESMHQRIFSLGGLLNRGDLNKTTGLTRFIYQTIRTTTQLSIKGIDLALSQFTPASVEFKSSHQRNQWISMLNGVIGDHLTATNNPLALKMSWHHQAASVTPQQMAKRCIELGGQPLLLIHGLCMNDQLWTRNGHDHGHELAKTKHIIPIYVRYNSGLAVYQNGQQLAQWLQPFLQALPAKTTCDVLCHSMGGLVMRSAMDIASKNNQTWHNRINKVVFLGTPHQGAVLEKTGNLIDYITSISPYSAPFTKLTKVRSHGIKNLRHGTVTEQHQTVQLPPHIDCYAIAGSTQENGRANRGTLDWVGDGLVSVDSALGQHKKPNKTVLFKTQNKTVLENVSHMGLLSDHQVFIRLQAIFN